MTSLSSSSSSIEDEERDLWQKAHPKDVDCEGYYALYHGQFWRIKDPSMDGDELVRIEYVDTESSDMRNPYLIYTTVEHCGKPCHSRFHMTFKSLKRDYERSIVDEI